MSAISRRVSFGMNGSADRSKYGNKKTLRHGITFHSKKEADRYDQLLLLERHGSVRKIRLQVRYDFRINGVLIAWYLADFVYEERKVVKPSDGRPAQEVWSEVVEDVKGFPAKTWPMKKKLMRALYGIDVRIA